MRIIVASMITAGMMAASSAADAAYTITISETGPDVVAIGVGSVNTTGLQFVNSPSIKGEVIPNDELAIVGQGNSDLYRATFTRTGSLGNGSGALASFNTGGPVGAIGPANLLFVPVGYVSGTAAPGTSTFFGQTIQSLGLIPGSVVFSFGSGATADTITFQIVPPVGTPAVPEPVTWDMMILGFGAIGGVTRFRRNGAKVTFV